MQQTISREARNIYGNTIHVCIDMDSPQVDCVRASRNHLILTHEAFRFSCGDSVDSCRALQMIKESDTEWIFFEYQNNIQDDSMISLHLLSHLKRLECPKVVLFDESFAEEGLLSYSDDDFAFAFDLYGRTPSNLLIERRVFDKLISQAYSLYPFPIQKILKLVIANGITIHKVHDAIPGHVLHGECLPVPYGWREEQSGKKLLVITHELSRTGAPLVLAEACINVLKKQGYKMLVLSPSDGPVGKMFLDNGISVFIQPNLLQMDCDLMYTLAEPYDAIVVSTTVPYACIRILNDIRKKVFWWIHECREGYQYVKEYLPEKLGKNIHVFCGGEYAKAVLNEFFPNYEAKVLLYGIQDRNPQDRTIKKVSEKRITFGTIAAVEERKGQDILAKAICLLDEQTRNKCKFLFVGNVNHPAIYQHIEDVIRKYPNQVAYKCGIPRSELDQIYRDLDCIVCPSRDDPMPAFVTEGMMFGKPAICSEHTGTAAVMKNGVNGFVYENDSPQKLAIAIKRYITLTDKQRISLAVQARRCYDENFSMASFACNMEKAMREVLAQDE